MRRPLPLAIGALGAALLAASAPAGAKGAHAVTLGPVVRVTTPGLSPCAVEGEPDVTVTSAGTWVGYNDDHECVFNYYLGRMTRLTSLQLLPASGGPARYVDGLLPAATGDMLGGDPALAPDPHTPGGVLIGTLYMHATGGTTIEVFRVSPSLAVSRLPGPHVHPVEDSSDDKEFLATDTNRKSRWFGRVYLAWDDFNEDRLVFRAFDGKRWLAPVRLGDVGKADVAVAPNGTVAVAYETRYGVSVAVSKDGGRSFGKPSLVIEGGPPGRRDDGCSERPTVGIRQRATKAVRVTYDAAGGLHVVAALTPPGVRRGGGVVTGGTSEVVHAVSGNGTTWRATTLGTAGATRFHPAVAPTPGGGVAVAWLETIAPEHATYDAYLAVAPRGSAAFGSPVRLSTAAAMFPSAMEAQLNARCYGIGDYIGLATTSRGVVTVWPTTDDETTPQVDSDVLLREAYLR